MNKIKTSACTNTTAEVDFRHSRYLILNLIQNVEQSSTFWRVVASCLPLVATAAFGLAVWLEIVTTISKTSGKMNSKGQGQCTSRDNVQVFTQVLCKDNRLSVIHILRNIHKTLADVAK